MVASKQAEQSKLEAFLWISTYMITHDDALQVSAGVKVDIPTMPALRCSNSLGSPERFYKFWLKKLALHNGKPQERHRNCLNRGCSQHFPTPHLQGWKFGK